jgi:hypothetical protein
MLMQAGRQISQFNLVFDITAAPGRYIFLSKLMDLVNVFRKDAKNVFFFFFFFFEKL